MKEVSADETFPTKNQQELQLRHLSVEGLFEAYNHEIEFPIYRDGQGGSSVVILHGQNGVGKTRVLRMLDGLLRLDFDPYRSVPFSKVALTFTDGAQIVVTPSQPRPPHVINVDDGGRVIQLNSKQAGALNEQEQPRVDEWRAGYNNKVRNIHLALILSNRHADHYAAQLGDEATTVTLPDGSMLKHSSKASGRKLKLRDRVRTFVVSAQADYRGYFAQQPALFSKILSTVTLRPHVAIPTPEELLERLESVLEQDQELNTLGLPGEDWDFTAVKVALSSIVPGDTTVQAMLSVYADALEGQTNQRILIKDRLKAFERVMNSMLTGKRIQVSADRGFVIITDSGQMITELELSTGEYHLLYLMVTALEARRKGTVIAIDEPEMSMHISWQRQLIRALFECSANAEPQLLLATHSPDIAANFPERMLDLPTSLYSRTDAAG